MATYANLSVKSREELKDYVKKSLGWPIVMVELTDSQLDFVIDDAIEQYTKYSAADEEYICLDLSQIVHEYFEKQRKLYTLDGTDIDEAEQLRKEGKYHKVISCGIKLPDNIIGVFNFEENTRGYYQNAIMMDGIMLSHFNGPFGNYGFNGFGYGTWGGIGFSVDWYVATQALKHLQQMRGYQITFAYNEVSKILTLDPDIRRSDIVGSGNWHKFNKDPKTHKFIILGVYTCRDADQVAGEPLVKKLAVALAKIQVGQIRSKFTGVNFPGGGSLSSDILQEGKDDRDAILEEIKLSNAAVYFSLQQ